MTTRTRRFALFVAAVALALAATVTLAIPAVGHGGGDHPAADAPGADATAADWLAWMEDCAAWMEQRAGRALHETVEHRDDGTTPVGDGEHGPHHGGRAPGDGTGTAAGAGRGSGR